MRLMSLIGPEVNPTTSWSHLSILLPKNIKYSINVIGTLKLAFSYITLTKPLITAETVALLLYILCITYICL